MESFNMELFSQVIFSIAILAQASCRPCVEVDVADVAPSRKRGHVLPAQAQHHKAHLQCLAQLGFRWECLAQKGSQILENKVGTGIMGDFIVF